MRTVRELQARLHPINKFQEKYNIEPDDKIHILYVSPTLNATGYYRMIAPALEINKTDTHKAIITGIENNDFSRKLSDFVSVLDEQLIIWADYIIFPALFSDVSYLLQAIKILNPQVQLVMDVDRNYFALPVSVPLSRKLTQEKLKCFETNLGLMDLVTVANVSFQNFLQKLIADRLPESNVLVQYLPSLVSKFGYEEMPPLKRNSSEKLRIGFIKPTEEDLLSLKEVLFKMRATLEKDIQFVCLGKPHYSKEGDILLKEIDCELHDTVSFTDYFEKLNNLRLDIALLPAKEGLFNKHQNTQLFTELSVFGVPTITSIHHSAKSILKEGETGLLASEAPEWIENIELMVKDSETRARLGRNALKWAWRFQSYNTKNIELLTEIFI